MTPDEPRLIDFTIHTDFFNIAERNRIDSKSIKILPVSPNNENMIDNNKKFYVFDITIQKNTAEILLYISAPNRTRDEDSTFKSSLCSGIPVLFTKIHTRNTEL